DLLAFILVEQHREPGPDGRPAFTTSVYPPMTFPPIAPVAWLAWPAARMAWTILMLAGVVIALPALARITRGGSTARLGLFAAVLALAPLHTGFSRGQPGIV